MITVAFIFALAMVLQIPALKVKDHIKMLVFVIWAAYGVIPTCHWYLEMGGSESQMVQVSATHKKHKVYIVSSLFMVNICKSDDGEVTCCKNIIKKYVVVVRRKKKFRDVARPSYHQRDLRGVIDLVTHFLHHSFMSRTLSLSS